MEEKRRKKEEVGGRRSEWVEGGVSGWKKEEVGGKMIQEEAK